MMLRNVVDDYFQELLHMLKLFTSPTHDGQQHPSTLWVHQRCQKIVLVIGLHTSNADFVTGLHPPMLTS